MACNLFDAHQSGVLLELLQSVRPRPGLIINSESTHVGAAKLLGRLDEPSNNHGSELMASSREDSGDGENANGIQMDELKAEWQRVAENLRNSIGEAVF